MKNVLFVIIFLSSLIYSQEKISLEFDYAKFKYDSSKTYLELYYAIGQSNLKPYVEDNISYIGAYLDVTIIDTLSKKVMVDKRYLSRTPLANSNDSTFSGKSLIGNLGFVLESGVHTLNISAVDVGDSTSSKSYTEIINVTEYDNDKYSLSDIQLSTRIISDSNNKNSIFYKNTMEVFPNPHNIYTESAPVLFYYSEIYNLNSISHEKSKMILVEQLNDSYGNVKKVKKKNLNTNNNSVVEAGVINLKKYPTGSYTLLLSIFADSNTVGISTSKKFYLINPSVKDEKLSIVNNMNVQSSEFGILSEEECDELFLVSEALLIENEKDEYERLKTVESKREFLFDFWRMRDQIPETPENEFKEEYLARVRLVDNKYRTFVKRGIQTDRGRIHLLYAEPDEIENYPNELNMKPFEIWSYYSIEGGVVFIFGDVTGYNNYELLHSTKRGELRDETWQRRISVD
jgi:GWxTD domain-containing protein